MTLPTHEETPSGSTGKLPENLTLSGDPIGWECMYNARNFIKKQLVANPRIKCDGASVGELSTDLGITIDGAPFNITIRARPMNKPSCDFIEEGK